MKKPKTLYRYNNYKLERHAIKTDCCPQFHMHTSYGDLWRCDSEGHDEYGYTSMKEAREEAIAIIILRRYEDKQWLEKRGIECK